MRGERKNNYLHLGEQHSKDTSTEGKGRDDERRLTAHRCSEERDMSIMGQLHRKGRLRENMSNESDGVRSVTVNGTSRDMGTTSEHMAKCKYNWQHISYRCNTYVRYISF